MTSLLPRSSLSLKSLLHSKPHYVTPVRSLVAHKVSGALHGPLNRAQVPPQPAVHGCTVIQLQPPHSLPVPCHLPRWGWCPSLAMHGLLSMLLFQPFPFPEVLSPNLYRSHSASPKDAQILWEAFPYSFIGGHFSFPCMPIAVSFS